MRSDSGTRAGFAPVVLWALASACASPAPPVPASATRAAATTALEVRVPHGRAMTLSTSAQPEFKHLLIEATGEGAPIARAEHLVRWVHQHVRFTPDRHQTLDALLEDRGGNCFDHASLTIALLRSSGFTARFVREVTAAPADEGRAAAARASKSSLFGYEHNDHTWVEVQVDGAWVPADTSLGLFGEREWLAGRVLRGDANPYGMITPFALVAYDDDRPVDRTSDHLVQAMAREFPAVEMSAAWEGWRADVGYFAHLSAGLLEGRYHVTKDGSRIHRMARQAAVLRRTLIDSGANLAPVGRSPVDLYLPSWEAAGSRYCFDPDSSVLREALTRAPPEPNEMLDARALAGDVERLHEAMRKQYAGYPELLQSPSFDIQGFFADWAERLRGGPARVSFHDQALEPNVAIRQALTDFHFSIKGWGGKLAQDPRLAFDEYQAPLDDAPLDVANCLSSDGASIIPTTLRVASILGLDRRRAKLLTVSGHGRRESIQLTCGMREQTLKRRPPVSRPEDFDAAPPYEEKSFGDALVITIRRLWGPPSVEEQLSQLAARYASHAKHRMLVFDLRHNGGGDDHYVRDWIAKAHRGGWDDYTELQIEGGALYPCFVWNGVVEEQIRGKRVDEPASRARRDSLRAEWSQERPPLHRLDPGRTKDAAPAPYRGRVFVLFARTTVSSGESSGWMLRQALGAMLVGERSGGYLEYGNVRTFVLPETGLAWQFGTKRNYYPTELEGVGLPVDVYLERVDAPIQEIVAALRVLGPRRRE